MMSRSYTNLLDLAEGNFPVMSHPREKKRLTRVMTVPGVISELDDDPANSVSSDVPSSVDVDVNEQDEVSQHLLDKFKCVPAFLPPEIFMKFYHGFCKQNLWPLFHYMLPLSVNRGGRFDRSLWEAYVAANKIFSQRVIEVINPEDDYVWIHDYHLMVLPTFLRRSRMFGLEYQSKRGYIGLEYYGRTIGIKIMPVGVHMEQIESALRLADEESIIAIGNRAVVEKAPKVAGKSSARTDHDPARGRGKDLESTQAEIKASCMRINEAFRQPGYEPIVFIDKPVSLSERVAYYTIAECVVVTAVRDGMNLTPYDGAIRVNPWNIEATAEAMNEAISMVDAEKQLRHEKHYRYVSSHDVAFWSRSFFQDMERTCKDHFRRRCWGIGLSFGFRVVALDPNFRKLSIDHMESVYLRSKNRAILFDYDGTVMPQASHNKAPSVEVISIINTLSDDSKNTVFVVSGRGRESLDKWFSRCKKLGIAAEHGYFMRWSSDDKWEVRGQSSEFGWKEIAEPVMKLYTEATDGSSIETKESALVWHHRDADPSFGSSQAKEMLDHLESVLANEPVTVKSGQYIIEVKPQGLTKGVVAEKIFTTMAENGRQADFVLCIGDDRSDEMFEIISSAISGGILSSNTSVFACTVGQKPSKAKYYLDDPAEVVNMLQALAEASDPVSLTDAESDISL
ncbi:putative alpha,alpha-trehalose-phosphate synthase 7 [Hibiscus syriacus]|uniref:Alpha,alpha-trehalose-phosphate synthase 7 n=1 Tax=Hibiscus syriacus TaxID=106335 RepID=A0A6A3BJG2_HIBSY|nr:putative alpha,alpha-trehalose-phosphate synthase 7 [Hibiscus syriacus]